MQEKGSAGAQKPVCRHFVGLLLGTSDLLRLLLPQAKRTTHEIELNCTSDMGVSFASSIAARVLSRCSPASKRILRRNVVVGAIGPGIQFL
jgi:hypothetical protein